VLSRGLDHAMTRARFRCESRGASGAVLIQLDAILSPPFLPSCLPWQYTVSVGSVSKANVLVYGLSVQLCRPELFKIWCFPPA